MPEPRGKIKELFNALPEEVEDLIFDPSTDKKIGEIGNKYKLHIDQIQTLTDETQYVMIGYKKPADFVSNTARNVGTTSDIAGLIVHDINEQIFNSIRESLKKIHNTDELIEIKQNNFRENSPQQENVAQITLEPIDKTILKESGIEIIDEPTNAVTNENLNRESVLNDIENPTKTAERALPLKAGLLEIDKPDTPLAIGSKEVEIKEASPLNIVNEKLTRDFSLPKQDSIHKLDPYREPV